jgi:hypothetical protein
MGGGDLTKELCKHYCLRGLEPYQSPSLNAEMHSHRCMHHQTVLKEQKRQRRASTRDPERIANQVSHMSEWALRRAQKLAVQDAQDALLQTDTSSRSSSSRQQQQQRRSSWHGHPASTPTPTSSSSASVSAASAIAKLEKSSSPSSSRSRVPSSSRRRRSLPNATPAFTSSAASTITSATSVSSASSSSSLSSSSEDQQQYQSQAVNVDQLKAWNVNLLQRMMSDQRHRRHSMTNPNASLAHTNSASTRRNIINSSRNISSIINSSSNIINNNNQNNNSANATNVANSLNNLHRAQASSEMSLHSLLVVPRTELLAKEKRETDFSSTNSLPPLTDSVNGAGSVDGNDSSSSNSMPSNPNNMPYRSFLRRDSLCGFKQL